MRSKWYLVSLALLASCAGSRVEIKSANFAKQLDAAKASASAQLHSPACPPPAHLNPERCGLLVTTFPADEMNAFIAQSCAGVKDQSCDAKIDAMIAKEWEVRYPKANRKSLLTWCAEHAEECKDSSRFETRMIDSHNEAVLAELKNTRAKIRKAAKEAAAHQGAPHSRGNDPSPAFQQQQHMHQQMHMHHHVPAAPF